MRFPFHPPRFTDETRPRNPRELIAALEAQRVAGWWRGVGVLLLIGALPLVLWVSVTIGSRARAQNCDVVERTFHVEHQAIRDDLVHRFGGDAAEFGGELQRDLDAKVHSLLQGCG